MNILGEFEFEFDIFEKPKIQKMESWSFHFSILVSTLLRTLLF